MHLPTALGLALATISTTLTGVAYLREHAAAAALPALSLRRPLQSLELLLTDRLWLLGFAMESGGFVCFAAALALAPLACRALRPGGADVLAYASAKLHRRRPGPRRSRG